MAYKYEEDKTSEVFTIFHIVSYLIRIVKAVIHEPSDEGGLSHALFAKKHQFEFSERVSKVARRRHGDNWAQVRLSRPKQCEKILKYLN